MKEDLLSLYFENEKRSGGGAVKDVVFYKVQDYAIVMFEDRSGQCTQLAL